MPQTKPRSPRDGVNGISTGVLRGSSRRDVQRREHHSPSAQVASVVRMNDPRRHTVFKRQECGFEALSVTVMRAVWPPWPTAWSAAADVGGASAD